MFIGTSLPTEKLNEDKEVGWIVAIMVYLTCCPYYK